MHKELTRLSWNREVPSLPHLTVPLAGPQRVLLSRSGEHRDMTGKIWELSETPTPVHNKPIQVISSPSSLGSCPPSGNRRTGELSPGRSWSRNVHVQSSLVLLLLLGLTGGTGSGLAWGVQHQAVCTSPGRSSVPSKDNEV